MAMLTHMYVNLTYQNDIVDKRKEALLLNSLSEMLRGMYHTGRQISYNRYFISQYRKRRKGNRDMTMKWDSFSNKDISVGLVDIFVALSLSFPWSEVKHNFWWRHRDGLLFSSLQGWTCVLQAMTIVFLSVTRLRNQYYARLLTWICCYVPS